MITIKRHIAALIVAVTLVVPAISYADGIDERPTFIEVATDAIFIRPAMLCATIIGSALFVVTLPFSWPTGTLEEAADILVIEPAKTFGYRCLGCGSPGYNHNRGEEE